MFIFDSALLQTKTNNIHPLEKLVYMMSMLVLSLIAKNIIFFFFIFSLSVVLIISITRIKISLFIKIMLLPIFFILTAIIPVIIGVSKYWNDSIVIFKFFNLFFYITKENLLTGMFLFLRTLTCISTFYLFILTTPIIEIEYLLNKMKLPKILIELFILIYRFIFVFINIASNIYLTQNCRIGYSNYKNSINSFSLLTSSLFIKSYVFTKNSYDALLSRGYNGNLNIFHKKYHFSFINVAFILAINALVIFVMNIKVVLTWF